MKSYVVGDEKGRSESRKIWLLASVLGANIDILPLPIFSGVLCGLRYADCVMERGVRI